MKTPEQKRATLLEWFKSERKQLPKVLTCDTCDEKNECSLVYDPYNINGDCLGDK